MMVFKKIFNRYKRHKIKVYFKKIDLIVYF